MYDPVWWHSVIPNGVRKGLASCTSKALVAQCSKNGKLLHIPAKGFFSEMMLGKECHF